MLKRTLFLLMGTLLIAASASTAQAQPDLFVSELSLDPLPPIERRPVDVRVGVYNQGHTPAGPFTVEWWAGENFPGPACVWQLHGLTAHGGSILTCRYAGYPSWYSRLTNQSCR